MLADQFAAAAAVARNTAALDEIARLTWRAHAEGQLQDVEAEAISASLQARRRAFSERNPAAKPAMPATGLLRPARRPRSPDRQASLARRRRQAMSGVVPAKIAASFTMAELAVLTVIARQCQRTGVCVLHIDAIAALAGCSRTSVQNALRQARLVGLILVKERRRPGQPSLTNVITIISKEWIAWLKLGGFKKLSTPDSHFHSRGENARIVPRGGGSRPSSGSRALALPSSRWLGDEPGPLELRDSSQQVSPPAREIPPLLMRLPA
jgi:hypothetical protein